MQSSVSPKRRNLPAVFGCTTVLFIAFLAFFSARWFVNIYGRIGFDSILYTLNSSLNGVEPDLIIQYLLKALLPCLLATVLFVYLLFFLPRRKNGKYHLPAAGSAHPVLLCILLALVLLGIAAFDCDFVGYVMDQLSDNRSDRDWLDELALKDAMQALPEREKTILRLRFFCGLTQTEVSRHIGISQAQVSRLEKGALSRIKSQL